MPLQRVCVVRLLWNRVRKEAAYITAGRGKVCLGEITTALISKACSRGGARNLKAWAPGGDVVRAVPVPKTLGLRHPRLRLRSRLPRFPGPGSSGRYRGSLTHRAIVLAKL